MSKNRFKSVNVSVRTQRCACCNRTDSVWQVSFRDPDRPGGTILTRPGGTNIQLPLRSNTVCSPEHVVLLVTEWMRDEMAGPGCCPPAPPREDTIDKVRL